MENQITVDRAALMQGVWDARDAKKISPDCAERIWKVVKDISRLGFNRRYICDYTELLLTLSQVDVHWFEIARLWEYFGNSLSSGISISSGSWTAAVEHGKIVHKG